MNKNRKIFNKLVRDKIPEILKAGRGKPETLILNGNEYSIKLNEKLLEECNEVISADGKNHLAEELADLLEVIMSIAKHNEINFENIEKIRTAKKEKRGGFDSKILLKSTEIIKNM